MKALKQRLIPALAALAISGPLSAADNDKTQPINIKSDHARYEANSGVYSGNVVMEQGPLRIEADKIVIYGVDKKVQRLLSFGKPASFFHRNDDGSVTKASADSIEYRIADEQVVLEHNAAITHQGSEIHGERIVYNSGQQTVSAEGDNDKRVKMILQPQTDSGDKTQDRQQDNSDDNARTESP